VPLRLAYLGVTNVFALLRVPLEAAKAIAVDAARRIQARWPGCDSLASIGKAWTPEVAIDVAQA
jgi:hypothetical protein